MKIYDLLVEFKKGVKAVKHNKKAKDPAKQFEKAKEKLAPVKPMEEAKSESDGRCMQCGMKNCKCPGNSCKCKPIAGWIPGKGFKKAMEESSLEEYGDTDKGQKMLTKVQKRAVDRVVSKRADTDPAYAKKNKATADAAWERMKDKDVAEGKSSIMGTLMNEGGWGRDSWDSNMPGWQQREQDAWDQGKREFKRRELEHELAHEDDPDFERKLRQQQIERDRGPWYLKINGKILKSKGEVKVFDWKKGANNYALAIIKNKPELQGKIMLTKRAEDDATESIKETASPGATSAGNVATLGMNPKLSPGPARGKKSYTGTPGKSGTKAPPQPKVIQPKGKHGTAKNALDMKSNIFGGGAVKRK